MTSSLRPPGLSLGPLVRGQRTAAHLVRSGAAGAILQVTSRILALLTSALLARTLGLEGYGIYAFAIALTGMFSILAEMGMGQLTLRETAQAAGDDAGKAATSSHLRAASTLVLACGITAAVMGALVLMVAPLALDPLERWSLVLALPLIVTAALTRIGVAVLAGLRKLVVSQVFEQVVTPLLVFAGALALFFAPREWATPQIAIAIQLAAGTLALLGLGLALRPVFLIRPDAAISRAALARRGWPFLMIGSALVLNQQLDTILVGLVLGTADVGPYRVATQGAQLAMFVSLVVNTIISPYAARFHAAGDRASLRKLFNYARLASVLSVGAALAVFLLGGRQLVGLVFGPEFKAAAPLLIILTAGYLGNVIAGPCGTILAMTGHERHSARAMWVTAILNGLCAIVAGRLFGVYGIAIVTAATLTIYQAWLRYIQWRELAV